MMGIRALLTTAFSLRAIPPLADGVNDVAHSFACRAQALAAGHTMLARVSAEAARAMTAGDGEARERAFRRAAELRDALDEIAGRLD